MKFSTDKNKKKQKIKQLYSILYKELIQVSRCPSLGIHMKMQTNYSKLKLKESIESTIWM